MKYDVKLKPAAERQLNKIKDNEFINLKEAIYLLGDEPRPIGVKKLAFGNIYRIRSGNFRIIYEINTEKKEVFITKVTRRSETTYKYL